MNLGVVVLAAGGSTRMGSPKQLLAFDGQTLLQRAIATARLLPVTAITVVLGANVQQIQTATQIDSQSDISVAINPDWQLGMGSSIRVGVAASLNRHPLLDSILITLCDQPRVDCTALFKLLNHFETGNFPAVAAGYSNTIGVPAVFGRSTFAALLALNSTGGAKPILTSLGAVAFPLPEAAVDVDTPDDFQLLTGR